MWAELSDSNSLPGPDGFLEHRQAGIDALEEANKMVRRTRDAIQFVSDEAAANKEKEEKGANEAKYNKSLVKLADLQSRATGYAQAVVDLTAEKEATKSAKQIKAFQAQIDEAQESADRLSTDITEIKTL